ncbi:MAG: hypothetical protein NVSMB65_11200 [Chloroflexota bacterium]
MAKLTRRGFIRKTSAGAATLGALAAVPGLVDSVQAAPQSSAEALTPGGPHGPLVAHVRNVTTGEIALLVGTREIIVRDHDLVRRLVKAAQ